MPVVVPFAPGVPFQKFSTTLDGVQYVFDVRWNGRSETWAFDLLDESEDPIRHGIRIVLGALLGMRGLGLGGAVAPIDPRMPLGQMIAVDTSGEGVDAGLHSLGRRVLVYYYSPDEAPL